MQSVRTPYYHRERDTLVVIERDLPSIAVTKMLKDYSLSIDTLFLPAVMTGSHG
jgi:hypothetical protein